MTHSSFDIENIAAIESMSALHLWLESAGVDVTHWGLGGAKRINDLWTELERGESVLQEIPPMRLLHVTQVLIRRQDKVLIEAEQEFRRGGRRRRNRPPAEKMLPGESYSVAAYRCLAEELGITRERVRLNHHSYAFTTYEGNPQSYPGLATRWYFHMVEACVDGLPASNFSTEEAWKGGDDPIARHFWEWRDQGRLTHQ